MNETPRRNRMDKMTPAEAAIVKVISIVEGVGASQDLTDAVVLLGNACASKIASTSPR